MLLNRGRTGQVTTRLPLPTNDVTKATGITTVTGEAQSVAAGAAGTTGNIILNYGPIASSKGDLVGRFGDTSLSIASGDAISTEIPYTQALNQYNALQSSGFINDTTEAPEDLTAGLSNGQFYVVYETGRLYYKKATANTAMTFTYKVRGSIGATGGAIPYGASLLTVKRAFANVAASQTDANIVTAVATKQIGVLAVIAVAGATATNLTFNTKPAGAGTAISPLLANGANGGEVLPFNQHTWFQTVAGEGLTVTTGAGSTTGILVLYVEI